MTCEHVFNEMNCCKKCGRTLIDLEHAIMQERLEELEEIYIDGAGQPLRWRGSGENIINDT